MQQARQVSAAAEDGSIGWRPGVVAGGRGEGGRQLLDTMIPTNLLIFWRKATAFPILLQALRSTPKAAQLQRIHGTAR